MQTRALGKDDDGATALCHENFVITPEKKIFDAFASSLFRIRGEFVAGKQMGSVISAGNKGANRA
ncbi:hypothetical protein HNQ08_005008 [Deinococcus humi]|uniref:Uncharacterized protein n=1 Tax=Deinococcus humi TaxID=662880 RepID=A0A7W8NJ89_9DEIO|nr:hypothetical protein [Deinococcus humi]GGO38809.1 hypothetical protein GCM10008949_45980 [Deinococcus humi]